MAISYTGGLNFSGPSKGDTNWDTTQDAANTKISGHDHTGGGNGTQIATAAIAANAVTDTKIRLANNATLRGRNQSGGADVDIVKVDTNNNVSLPTRVVLGVLTPASGSSVAMSTNYVDLNSAGPATLTVNVPTAANAGQPVFMNNSGAGTWTVTITGRPAASDVVTIPANGAVILLPCGTTCWNVISSSTPAVTFA